MMAVHRMTPARRAALKKAQLASARKRRGHGKGKLAAANRKSRRNARIAVGVGAVAAAGTIGAVAYTVHKNGKRHKMKASKTDHAYWHYKKVFVAGHLRKRANTRAETRKRFGQPSMRESTQSPTQIRRGDTQSAHLLWTMHHKKIIPALKKRGY